MLLSFMVLLLPTTFPPFVGIGRRRAKARGYLAIREELVHVIVETANANAPAMALFNSKHHA